MNSSPMIFGLSAVLVVSFVTGSELPDRPPVAVTAIQATNELRLNFRSAPLESVLQYLSQAAGFIIDLRTEVKGKTTVWSNQPVTVDEAVQLLSSALDKNGYTAIREGRTLTIYGKDDAKKRNLPVRSGAKPEGIPKSDEMVTQILPVRYISAVQVARDLQPLLPDGATMTANEGSNALVITDTQANIRRLAEILNALDSAVSSVSRIRVFPLQFADAKAVAGVVKDLFQSQDTSRSGGQNQTSGNTINTFQAAGPQGGGFPNGPGGASGGRSANSTASSGRGAPTPKVVAVAEERSNSVVVNAPEEQVELIAHIIGQIDINVQDVTEMRVLHLRNADPQETADLLTELFADSTSGSNSANRGPVQFGGSPSTGAGATGSTMSTRLRNQAKVAAVPDLRTGSIVIMAARELMPQIERIVLDLDSDGARKQQVFVFNVPHSDAQSVQDILQSLFPAPSSASSSSARQSSRQQNGVGNQLNNRATQSQNQRSGQRSGSSGFGGSGSLGVGGGGGFGSTGQ